MGSSPSSGSRLRRIAFALAAALLLAAGCSAVFRKPSIGEHHTLREQPSATGALTAYFFGTSSVLVKDDSSAILIDGFVSRPSLSRVIFRRIGPDSVRIDTLLRRLGIDSITAVVTTHSDYDHAMDAPLFARLYGAKLVGSQSTRQIGLGAGVDGRVIHHGDTARYKGFHLTFLRSKHGSPQLFPGTVKDTLRPPAKVWAWQSDIVYAVLIRHNGRSILFNPTADFHPEALADTTLKADVVYLASTGLYRRRSSWVDRYWRGVVRDRGACRVILVHWDNFFRSLDKELVPMRWPVDSFGRSMARVLERGRADSVDVRLPVVGIPTDPFAGLEFEPAVPFANLGFRPNRQCRAPVHGGGR